MSHGTHPFCGVMHPDSLVQKHQAPHGLVLLGSFLCISITPQPRTHSFACQKSLPLIPVEISQFPSTAILRQHESFFCLSLKLRTTLQQLLSLVRSRESQKRNIALLCFCPSCLREVQSFKAWLSGWREKLAVTTNVHS